jgi:hypothetical protein
MSPYVRRSADIDGDFVVFGVRPSSSSGGRTPVSGPTRAARRPSTSRRAFNRAARAHGDSVGIFHVGHAHRGADRRRGPGGGTGAALNRPRPRGNERLVRGF